MNMDRKTKKKKKAKTWKLKYVIRDWTEPTGGLFTSNPENGLIDKGAFESGSCPHANREKG